MEPGRRRARTTRRSRFGTWRPASAGRRWKGIRIGCSPSRSRRMGSGFCRGRYDRTVRVWDAGSGREVAKLEGHTGGLWSVVALRDNARALSGGFDKTLRLWELASGKCLKTIECGTDERRRRVQQRRQSGGDSSVVGASRRAGPALEPRNGPVPGDAEGPFGRRELRPDHAGRTVCRFGVGRQDRQGLGPGSGNLRRDAGGPSGPACIRSPSPPTAP